MIINIYTYRSFIILLLFLNISCKFLAFQPISLLTSYTNLLISNDISNAYDYSIVARIPTESNPLKYIDFPLIVSYGTNVIPKSILSVLLPTSSNDLVASFIAEGCSGFLGGVAGKLSSILNKNKNSKDSSIQSGLVSGAYFGISGAVRSFSQLFGVSILLESILSFTVASIASEFLKFQSRSVAPKMTRVGNGPTMYDLMKFQNPSMKEIMKFNRRESDRTPVQPPLKKANSMSNLEIVSDLGKWLTIAALIPPPGNLNDIDFELTALIGFLSGVISELVRENGGDQGANLDSDLVPSGNKINFWRPITKVRTAQKKNIKSSKKKLNVFQFIYISAFANKNKKEMSISENVFGEKISYDSNFIDIDSLLVDNTYTKIARAGIESASQILVYIASRDYVYNIAPYFNTDASNTLSIFN